MFDEKQFKLICFISSYLLIKDNCESDKKNSSLDKKEATNIIVARLRSVEKIAHIPNKEKIASSEFEQVLSLIEQGEFDEQKMLEDLSSAFANGNDQFKEWIINCIIHIAYYDEKISNSNKEILIQVAHYLGTNKSYDLILDCYSKSDLCPKKKLTSKNILALALLPLISILFLVYTLNREQNNELNIFNNERVVFSEISFNRMVTYTNKFIDNNANFLRRHVYYIYGSAEIGFNPNNIFFDVDTRNIEINSTESGHFDIKVYPTVKLIDNLVPKPISPEEAAKISAVVGIAGGIVGGLAGNQIARLTSFIPGASLKTEVILTASGAIIGGAGAAYVTFNALDGLELAKEIGNRESDVVINKSIELVNASLHLDEQLQLMYRSRFENFIRATYLAAGIEINNIIYLHD